MKKARLIVFIVCFATAIGYASSPATLNAELLEIKAKTSAETIGLVFNPEASDLEGAKVSVKTLALPATNGPTLIQNLRTIVTKVDAIYLIEGRNVTSPKLAKFVVKNAQRHDVKVFSNDPALADIPGIHIIRVSEDGSIQVQDLAD